MKSYSDFLSSKDLLVKSCGFEVGKNDLNPMLYDFQKDIVRFSLMKGRSAIFADCGLTPYVAIRMRRRGMGVELKESYYKQAVANCHEACREEHLPDLYGETPEDDPANNEISLFEGVNA